MKRNEGVFIACLCLIIASCKSPFSSAAANLVLDGNLVGVMTSDGRPEFDGAVINTGNNTAYYCKVVLTCYSDEAKTTLIDTAIGYPANLGDIPAGTRAVFQAVAFNCTSHEQIKAMTVNISWLDR
ncbi:MAG: hypothetical protein NTW38_04040 [Candidatus Aminicenantes bacterium]|nr:hypothetical protein [Candidatus Aminicenantes bacterium]